MKELPIFIVSEPEIEAMRLLLALLQNNYISWVNNISAPFRLKFLTKKANLVGGNILLATKEIAKDRGVKVSYSLVFQPQDNKCFLSYSLLENGRESLNNEFFFSADQLNNFKYQDFINGIDNILNKKQCQVPLICCYIMVVEKLIEDFYKDDPKKEKFTKFFKYALAICHNLVYPEIIDRKTNLEEKGGQDREEEQKPAESKLERKNLESYLPVILGICVIAAMATIYNLRCFLEETSNFIHKLLEGVYNMARGI